MAGTTEISRGDAACHADFSAVTTAGADIIIDAGEVVLYLDGSHRALLFTLAAGNAAAGAGLACDSTLFGIAAPHMHLHNIGQCNQKMVGTHRRAKAAANAETGVDMSDAVLNAEGTIRAGLYTVAITEAAERTLAGTAEQQLCRRTAFDAMVVHLRGGGVAVTGALQKSHLLRHIFTGHTQKFTELFCRPVSTGNTEI